MTVRDVRSGQTYRHGRRAEIASARAGRSQFAPDRGRGSTNVETASVSGAVRDSRDTRLGCAQARVQDWSAGTCWSIRESLPHVGIGAGSRTPAREANARHPTEALSGTQSDAI